MQLSLSLVSLTLSLCASLCLLLFKLSFSMIGETFNITCCTVSADPNRALCCWHDGGADGR